MARRSSPIINSQTAPAEAAPAARARFDIFLLLDIGLNLWLAWRFFQLWVMPAAGDGERIAYMAVLMAFEFIMVHSGVFMAVMPWKISLLVFVPFYGLFALCFNTMVPDNSILWLYLAVVLNRMRFAFFNASEADRNMAIGQSVYAAVIYFFLLMGVGFLSFLVPCFGLTPAFLEQIGYNPSVGGLFTEQPETAMCAGFTYYVLLAVFYAVTMYNGLKRVFRKVDIE